MKKKHGEMRSMKVPVPASQTIRQQMRDRLLASPHSTRDLSMALGIAEKDVVDHLGHLSRSLSGSSIQLQMEPCRCLSCGFEFRERRRFTKPGRCPACKKTYLSSPLFWLASARKKGNRK